MLKITTEKQKHTIEYMGAKFIVELNTTEESQDIIKKNTYPHKIKGGPGQKNRQEERVNWVGVQMDNLDSQIVSWEGIADKLECNSENKRKLASLRENEHICLHIQDKISELGQAVEEIKKAKAKN